MTSLASFDTASQEERKKFWFNTMIKLKVELTSLGMGI